jgi:probable rRNA maturation factor
MISGMDEQQTAKETKFCFRNLSLSSLLPLLPSVQFASVPFIIEIADDEQPQRIDKARLKKAVRLVLKDAGIKEAEISIAVVTDARMHELNRIYLEHDYPTDVLTFVLESNPNEKSLDGEIIVSSEYAAREAIAYGWTTDDELLLYVIHGALHLVGHDDTTPEAKQAMREAEATYLAQFGLEHRYKS